MRFESKIHRRLFYEAVRNRNDAAPKVIAAIYLLTSQRHLWKKTKPYALTNDIKFMEMDQTGYSPDEYTLIDCAKDICLETRSISLLELANVNRFPPRLFTIIITALKISRTGVYTDNCKKGGPN